MSNKEQHLARLQRRIEWAQAQGEEELLRQLFEKFWAVARGDVKA